MDHKRTAHCLPGVLLTSLLFAIPVTGFADDEDASAEAPERTDVFETTSEGTWFVERGLKKRYDGLLAAAGQLEQRVRNGDLSPSEAREEIAALRTEIAEVRQLIDEQKTLVNPFQVVTQTVEETIELGSERLLVVTADRLKVVGWDEPHAKFVVEKEVLSTGEPVDEHLRGICVIHERRVAPDLVGKTDEEMEDWREEFFTAKAGEEWTQEQLAARQESWERYFASGERHRAFLGREVDTVHVEGLTGQEGNQHLSYSIMSPEGGGQVGGRWRRSARVTLYVPQCVALLLRGCQMGIDVSGVSAHLIMTAQGSQNRDYNGRFSVRDHEGDVTLLNVPVDTIDRVAGNVQITATSDMVNTGSHHRGGLWTLYVPPPRSLTVSGVTGDLTAHFRRSDLQITGVDGAIDVHNGFGATRCAVSSPLSDTNHRIVSESGLVQVVVAAGAELGIPVFASTGCGTLATNLSRRDLDDQNIAFTSSRDGKRYSWRSLLSKLPPGDFAARSMFYERPDDVLNNRPRSHGLDLISVAGRVEYRHQQP